MPGTEIVVQGMYPKVLLYTAFVGLFHGIKAVREVKAVKCPPLTGAAEFLGCYAPIHPQLFEIMHVFNRFV